MKKVTLAFALLTLSFISFSQSKSFKKGDNLLNIGIGANSVLGGLPIGASFEKGITKDISVGGNIDYLSSSNDTYSTAGNISEKFTALYFGVRASYHFNEILKVKSDNIDLYGGGALGYRNFKWSSDLPNLSVSGSFGSGIYLGAFIGGKYYFTENIGAFAELGAGGSSYARLGVAFKF